MLETLDLDAKLSKEEFKKTHGVLELKLAELQRQVRAAGIPVIVVFEGLQASGIGRAISRLLSPLDPRGYKLRMFNKPDVEEALRPPFWRYWMFTPARGQIALYDRSWYGPILDGTSSVKEAYERMRTFERQLTDDGTVITKFWLHISKEEQTKRYKKLEKDPSVSWRVSKEDWDLNRRHAEYCRTVDAMLAETSTANAPWTLIPAHDNRYMSVQIAQSLAAALENALERKKHNDQQSPLCPHRPPSPPSPLDSVDLTLHVERDEYERQYKKLSKELLRLEGLLFVHRIPVVIAYEGWDAAGKGGNIKRLVGGLDHRGFEVIPIAAPEGDERTHHYLWRFWRHLPKAGHITVFDRTWYGRVMVERIEGFAKPDEWGRAYQEINEFEEELTSFGTVLVKFWIHLSKDEQLKRFKLREKTPYKKWKITEEDWRNRKKWNLYYTAVSDMIERTSTPNAPWTIIEGNDKLHARIKALKTTINAITQALDTRTSTRKKHH